MGNVKLETIWLPRPASKYKGSFPLHFEEKIRDILETDNFIHIFAGMTNSGLRVDIKPEYNQWTSEMVRVVRPGGKIAIMQNYIVPRLQDCKMVKILTILNRIKHYPKIVTIQSKFKIITRQTNICE